MPHPACDRAHQWISLQLDDELSAFEGTLLRAHLAECGDCVAFQTDVTALTAQLREAHYQPIERKIGVVRRRRRVPARLAPAVAALAIGAVGLGSLLATLTLGQDFNPARRSAAESAAALHTGPLAVNRSKIFTLQTRTDLVRSRIGPMSERRIGGPVVPGSPVRG
jgi:predicted anti-sigma-YlaC factor YlaD